MARAKAKRRSPSKRAKKPASGAPAKKRELEPWEPDPAWHPARIEAFTAYRDLGQERSTAAVARALGKSKGLMDRWSGEDGWVDRVAHWEAECDRRRREEFEETSAEIGYALAMDAEKLRRALLSPAEALVAKLEEARSRGEDPFEGMKASDLVRLSATAGRAFAQVATVERLARGQTTENIGGHDGGPLVGAEVAAKSMGEVEAYMLGRAEEREQRETADADA